MVPPPEWRSWLTSGLGQDAARIAVQQHTPAAGFRPDDAGRIAMNRPVKTILAAMMASMPAAALAHPHVFAEANLEIVRDGSGEVTELRHVWRFDELFTSTVVLDFDADGDGKLDTTELDEVSSVVTESIGEYDYYTAVRLDGRVIDFQRPERIMAMLEGEQLLMFFALKLEAPLAVTGGKFAVAVSDPTYYVAMEIADEAAVQVSGSSGGCGIAIARPDFDELLARSPQTLTEQFFENPEGAVLGDEWLTWVNFECK
jgi:ABC-type uncharacterized transport system substrate-binding protein